jgi:hypothetical protein
MKLDDKPNKPEMEKNRKTLGRDRLVGFFLPPVLLEITFLGIIFPGSLRYAGPARCCII